MGGRAIRLATRKSELAMAQTETVMRLLAKQNGGVEPMARPIVSRGDQIVDRPLQDVGGKDLFVKALEEAILAGEADAAVHSLKDVGARLDPRFVIASTPERADPRDVLVSRTGADLAGLAPGSAVGTSSPRRAALVRSLRPDLRVVPVRGNVRTRLDKLGSGIDALILAAAGLARLELLGLVKKAPPPRRRQPALF